MLPAGGPIFPVPGEHEKGIVDLDTTFSDYKKKFRKSLDRTWRDLVSKQTPILPNLNSTENQIVRNIMIGEQSFESHIVNANQTSYFNRNKKSPRGIKSGQIKL